MEGRSRYDDGRLDDKFRQIERDLELALGYLSQVTELSYELKALHDDTAECKKGIDSMRQSFEERRKERQTEAKERQAERVKAEDQRRSDRRFLVGTIIAASGLVVTALSLLVNHL